MIAVVITGTMTFSKSRIQIAFSTIRQDAHKGIRRRIVAFRIVASLNVVGKVIRDSGQCHQLAELGCTTGSWCQRTASINDAGNELSATYQAASSA